MVMAMKVERVFVTPEIASAMLTQNTKNFRKLDKNRVAQYAKDIASGNWDENGETIKVNGTTLLDGQHRLSAINVANKGVWMLIVYGVEASAINIDRGRPRKFGQWLAHTGCVNANRIASIAKAAIEYEQGAWLLNSSRHLITDHAMMEYISTNKDRIESASRLSSKAKLVLQSSVLGTILFIGCLDEASENEFATWFVERLANGDELHEQSALLHLRNRLQSSKTKRYTLPVLRRMATFTWNRECENRECTSRQFASVVTAPTASPMMSKIIVRVT
jgi:outer membrane murein-binding lipoprotein Lpp